MTKAFTISEEMLDSLASEYMTPDAASIIVCKVKEQTLVQKSDSASGFDIKFAQVRAMKEIFQWITYADTPDQDIFPGNYSDYRIAWEATRNKILLLQRRILPKVPKIEFELFNDMTRDKDFKDARETEWFDTFKQKSGE